MADKTALALEGARYYLERNGFKNIRYYMAHPPCNMDAEKDGVIYDVLVLSGDSDFEVEWSKLEGLLSIPFAIKGHRVLLMFSNDSGQALFELHSGRIFKSEYGENKK